MGVCGGRRSVSNGGAGIGGRGGGNGNGSDDGEPGVARGDARAAAALHAGRHLGLVGRYVAHEHRFVRRRVVRHRFLRNVGNLSFVDELERLLVNVTFRIAPNDVAIANTIERLRRDVSVSSFERTSKRIDDNATIAH